MQKTLFLSSVLFLFSIIQVNSQNLIKNPGFESGGISLPWDKWSGGNSSVTINSTQVYSGSFSVKLTGTEAYLYQPVNLMPNTTYKIKASVKADSGNELNFGVNNIWDTTGVNIVFNNTVFKTDSATFTTDGNVGGNTSIYFWKDKGTGSAWVDEVELITETTMIETIGGSGSYYVSLAGDDTNSGTSPENAWKTIDRVNQLDFEPGDHVLFKGGETYVGTIRLNESDSGTNLNNVIIDSYGSGRATINALTGSGLIASDCKFLTVKNINFTGAGRKDGNTGDGIVFNFCSNIVADSIDISGFQHAGLKVGYAGENFRFTNINANANGYAGIYINGMNKTVLSNIYIGHCVADNNPGDPTVLDNHSGNGIFAYNANNILIEFCVASNNGGDMPRTGNGPGGIWVAEVDSVVIQHCISHNNKTSAGGDDGLGFDLDGGTTNTIIQYCLSYNNQGAGYGIFQYAGATDWNNNTVRYCISENDGNTSARGSVVLWNGYGSNSSSKFRDFEFYNNVVYNANGPALAFLDHYNSNINFRNNIFVSKQKSIFNWSNNENYQANCWYSLNGEFYLNAPLYFEQWAQDNDKEMLDGEIVGMYADPVFVNPGNSTITDPTQLSMVNDYKVLNDSPVIDSGLDLDSIFNIYPGIQDYFGNVIKQGMAFDMGVFESVMETQQIALSAGWNIMSFRLMPDNADLENILQPLIALGNLKKVMDEEGKIIEDWGVNNGGVQNTIGDLQNTEGYKINVINAATIELEGLPVQFPYDIELVEGWNIISWPNENEQNGIEVFAQLIIEGKVKKIMDEAGNSIEDWGAANGGWKNGIGNFVPGEGYKVNVTSACTLNVNARGSKSEMIPVENKQSTHFIPAYHGNGTDHMNINLLNISESGILDGDEIGVFDGDICVGSVRITNLKTSYNVDNLSISIPVSAAEGNGGENGYSEGNPIAIKLYRDGIEQQLKLEPLNNNKSVFAKGASLFAQVGITTGLDEKIGLNISEINCYPNPFSEEITIELNLANNSEVQVEVINQLGQLVKTVVSKRQLNCGVHQLIWNGRDVNQRVVTPGVYHIRIVINEIIFHRKIAYFK